MLFNNFRKHWNSFRSTQTRGFSRFNRYFYNKPPDHMTKMLISTNIGVYIAWQILDSGFMRRNFLLNEYNLRNGRFYTIVTSAFSHMNLMHLAANMIGLWFFGVPLEAAIGAGGLLAVYMAGAFGSFAALTYQFKGRRYRYALPNVLGASGATSAIFCYFICGNPWQPVLLFFIPMPAILAGLVIFGLGGSISEPVSHAGHVGGGLAGAAYYFLRKAIIRY
jgi:membrane associated rhomboid family serine protease